MHCLDDVRNVVPGANAIAMSIKAPGKRRAQGSRVGSEWRPTSSAANWQCEHLPLTDPDSRSPNAD